MIIAIVHHQIQQNLLSITIFVEGITDIIKVEFASRKRSPPKPLSAGYFAEMKESPAPCT